MKTLTQYEERKARVFNNTLQALGDINGFLALLDSVDKSIEAVNLSTATNQDPYGQLIDSGLYEGLVRSKAILKKRKVELEEFLGGFTKP